MFGQVATRLAAAGHGSLVVISEAALEEAARLGLDSLPVSPLPLTPDSAAMLSRIDGALLCDATTACHAIGVILDGRSTASGDRGRGSRYNSALRYVTTVRIPTAAMVVSDDGGLDLLPRLKPPLSRSELERRLGELERLANSPASPPDREREVDVGSWFEKHAYYLDSTQCEHANQWLAICNDRAFADASLRVHTPPLKTDAEFDPFRDLV
jgi:hypothetical protein